MSDDHEMPERWRRHGAARANEITAAIIRARAARGGEPAALPIDELARRRAARQAAEEARRRMQPTDPPGPASA